MIKKLLATLAVALFGTGSSAATVTTGTVYNNTAGAYSSTFGVARLHDQSGLSSRYVSGVTDFATYISSGVTHGTAEGGRTWLSNRVPNFPAYLDFDLGSVVNILQLAWWNGASNNTADVKQFSVTTSNDATFASGTAAGTFTNPMGSTGPETVAVFDLLDTNARYVRIQLSSYYGNPCCAAIGEIAFDAGPVSAVPVPASLPLLLAGIGGLAALRRKKR